MADALPPPPQPPPPPPPPPPPQQQQQQVAAESVAAADLAVAELAPRCQPYPHARLGQASAALLAPEIATPAPSPWSLGRDGLGAPGGGGRSELTRAPSPSPPPARQPGEAWLEAPPPSPLVASLSPQVSNQARKQVRHFLTCSLTYSLAHVQVRARDELPPPSELAAQWASARQVRSKRPILAAFSMREIATPAPETAPLAPVPTIGSTGWAAAGSSARPARRSESPEPPKSPEAEADMEAEARAESSSETKPRRVVGSATLAVPQLATPAAPAA